MEEITGTKIRAMTVREGHIVDCRNWLEFAIIGHRYDGDRVRYRIPEKLDDVAEDSVESDQHTGRASA
jgi:hypothetical protein